MNYTRANPPPMDVGIIVDQQGMNAGSAMPFLVRVGNATDHWKWLTRTELTTYLKGESTHHDGRPWRLVCRAARGQLTEMENNFSGATAENDTGSGTPTEIGTVD
jgi:hypothetical protein